MRSDEPPLAEGGSEDNVVARSSTKVKFRAMAQGICDLPWIKSLLKDLNVGQIL